MTTRPDPTDLVTGTVASGGSTAQEARDWIAQLGDFVGQMPGAQDAETKVIASGSVTPTRHAVKVDTEGAAATDDLAQIVATNLPDGSVIMLSIVDAGRKVTVKHAAGGANQIFLHGGSDFLLESSSQYLWLIRTASQWVEIHRAWGTALSAWRAHLGLSAAATFPVASIAQAQAGSSNAVLMTPARLADALATYALMVGNRSSIAPAQTDELLIGRPGGALYKAPVSALGGGMGAPGWVSGWITYGGSYGQGQFDLSSTFSAIHLIRSELRFVDSVHGYAWGRVLQEGSFHNVAVYLLSEASMTVAYRLPASNPGIGVINDDSGSEAAIQFGGDVQLRIKVWGDPV